MYSKEIGSSNPDVYTVKGGQRESRLPTRLLACYVSTLDWAGYATCTSVSRDCTRSGIPGWYGIRGIHIPWSRRTVCCALLEVRYGMEDERW